MPASPANMPPNCRIMKAVRRAAIISTYARRLTPFYAKYGPGDAFNIFAYIASFSLSIKLSSAIIVMEFSPLTTTIFLFARPA